MKTNVFFTIILGAAMTLSSALSAQDRITVNGNIDLVNNYVWRGMDQNSGFSLQPTLSLSYKGLSLSAWGSQSITNNADRDVQELDINLSYSTGGFSATLTDYWWGGLHNPYGYYKQGPADNPIDGGHHLEATMAYRVSYKYPLTISWSTWMAGADVRTSRDKRCYSSYINASYDIACPAQVTPKNVKLQYDLIHHSDRGIQYASFAYTDILKARHMHISMTECGDPKDNAVAERVNGIIKNELLKDVVFHSIEEVRAAVADAIDFYNNERPHMSLDWKTPAEAALCTGELRKKWVSHRENFLKQYAA